MPKILVIAGLSYKFLLLRMLRSIEQHSVCRWVD